MFHVKHFGVLHTTSVSTTLAYTLLASVDVAGIAARGWVQVLIGYLKLPGLDAESSPR